MERHPAHRCRRRRCWPVRGPRQWCDECEYRRDQSEHVGVRNVPSARSGRRTAPGGDQPGQRDIQLDRRYRYDSLERGADDDPRTRATAATAPQVALVGPPTAALGLDLTADVLEVSVGEAIPFTATIRNPGAADVTNLQITAQLPAGARYVVGTAIGADSALFARGRLILYSGAALTPGASRTLRFVAALVSPSGTMAETRAVATGQVTGGLAGSPEAIAWVQIRRAWPMETRAAIGKVWIDANGDGVQQTGEPGIANVDVWTEDGMVATTDSSGKFSFVNVRP